MDSATQFLLGASVVGVTLGKTLGPRALLVGGLLGTLPDLDSLIPMDNAIDDMTYHRGFSHSLFVLTAISPAIAFALTRKIAKLRDQWWLTLLAVWLCLVTHPLLDSLTTYGTQLFWPFGTAPPVAFSSVFIIDPAYTLPLLFGVIAFWWRRAFRVMATTLTVSTLYLCIGMTGHMLVQARAEADPLFKGKSIHVQPAPFNILGWQVLGVDNKEFIAALTGIAPGCDLVPVRRGARIASPPAVAGLSPSTARLEWFTNGFYEYQVSGQKLIQRDMRIGFSPNFIFSFNVAEMKDGKFTGIIPKRHRLQASRSVAVGNLLQRLKDVVATC